MSVTGAVVSPALPHGALPISVKLATGSLKTTVKLIGLLLAGSAWVAAWLMVTVGAVVSYVTVLSVLVEALLVLVAASVATPAAMEAITVPSPVIALTATL